MMTGLLLHSLLYDVSVAESNFRREREQRDGLPTLHIINNVYQLRYNTQHIFVIPAKAGIHKIGTGRDVCPARPSTSI
jgi:hypothetical protein